jgi:hypothetical protein
MTIPADSAAPPPVSPDRSDFRNVMLSGAKVGVVTAVAVVVYSGLARVMPAGIARELVLTLVVLATGTLVSFLPAQWVTPRSTEGIAGAAAVGLWGTIVFMAIDVAVLRPVNHFITIYPWTWDALGGLSTWWYLPIWWMLGTLLAWMGGMLTAAREAVFPRVAAPVLAGAGLIAIVGRLVGCPVMLPVTAGAGFTLTLTVLAVAAIARKA